MDIKEAVADIKGTINETKAATLTEVDKKIAETKSATDKLLEEKDAKINQLIEDATKQGLSIGEILNEVKELKAGKGRFSVTDKETKSTQSIIADGIAESFEKIKQFKYGESVNIEHKVVGTMTASANLTGSVVQTMSNIYATRGIRRSKIRDLVQVVPTATGSWVYYRQNTPVGEGSFGFQTTHGGLKAQLDYDYTRVEVTVDYLAGFVVIAKQMLQDLPFMQTQVTTDLVEDYNRAESGSFFGQLASAATGNTGVNGATVYAEKIVNWIANMLEADRDVNGIVTNAANWATLMNTKPNDYSLPGGGSAITIAADGTVYFLGIPVYITSSLYLPGSNKTLIGDFNYAKILQAEGLNTNIYEQDSDNVRRNLVTVKTEARVALAVLRPDAFIYA